jgi:hypothetical protein
MDEKSRLALELMRGDQGVAWIRDQCVTSSVEGITQSAGDRALTNASNEFRPPSRSVNRRSARNMKRRDLRRKPSRLPYNHAEDAVDGAHDNWAPQEFFDDNRIRFQVIGRGGGRECTSSTYRQRQK